MIADRLSAGGALLTLEVPLALSRALYAGRMKDSSLFEEMQQAIAENRRREDGDAQ
jgi:hypothetical protein